MAQIFTHPDAQSSFGNSKALTTWIDMKLLGPQEFKVIQDNVDSFTTPSDVGRIPGKIVAGFTAEQWRNWTVIFSFSSLKKILPRQHFDCWHKLSKLAI